MVTPIRLQAYERMVLFMERINPESLILRTHQDGLNAKEFHVRLIKSIREEYEHNITQQMYVSVGAWNMVTNAKNNIVKLCNIVKSHLSILVNIKFVVCLANVICTGLVNFSTKCP